MKPLTKLARDQIEKRLSNLRAVIADASIRTGWITYMREAMCMTQSILAKASGMTQATVQQIEKREREGNVTINTMRKIAAAMDCEFIYVLVPKQELSELLKMKALVKAKRMVEVANIHMTLEDQQVSGDINTRIERIAEDLLAKGDIW